MKTAHDVYIAFLENFCRTTQYWLIIRFLFLSGNQIVLIEVGGARCESSLRFKSLIATRTFNALKLAVQILVHLLYHQLIRRVVLLYTIDSIQFIPLLLQRGSYHFCHYFQWHFACLSFYSSTRFYTWIQTVLKMHPLLLYLLLKTCLGLLWYCASLF